MPSSPSFTSFVDHFIIQSYEKVRYQVVYSLYRDWLTIVRVSYDDCKAKASHAHLERTGDRILTNLRYHHNGAVATKSRQPRRGQNKNNQRHDVKPRKAHDEQSRRICSACGFDIIDIPMYTHSSFVIFYSLTMLHIELFIHYRLYAISCNIHKHSEYPNVPISNIPYMYCHIVTFMYLHYQPSSPFHLWYNMYN